MAFLNKFYIENNWRIILNELKYYIKAVFKIYSDMIERIAIYPSGWCAIVVDIM